MIEGFIRWVSETDHCGYRWMIYQNPRVPGIRWACVSERDSKIISESQGAFYGETAEEDAAKGAETRRKSLEEWTKASEVTMEMARVMHG